MFVLPVLLATLLTACTGGSSDTSDASPPSASASASASASSTPTPDAEPSASATPSGSATPERPARPADPATIPSLFDKEYDGGRLRLGDVLARTDAYTSYVVTYRSDGRRVSGKLDVPRGRGPFPTVVLAHGYIDPAVYVNGQGMRREQDWLARAGYVVLHADYRNHAFSGEDPAAERNLRVGYASDVVNAVLALRRTTKVPVDDDRVGLVGRSMGGGVIYSVLAARPGLVDAAVVFAPVSSRTADNFNRWTRPDPGRSTVADAILRRHGEPRDNPAFWRRASPRTFFGRITEPVLIHHGTADSTCPPRWSRATLRALRAAGVDATLRTYAGEEHAFIAQWPLSMRRTTAFLRRNL